METNLAQNLGMATLTDKVFTPFIEKAVLEDCSTEEQICVGISNDILSVGFYGIAPDFELIVDEFAIKVGSEWKSATPTYDQKELMASILKDAVSKFFSDKDDEDTSFGRTNDLEQFGLHDYSNAI